MSIDSPELAPDTRMGGPPLPVQPAAGPHPWPSGGQLGPTDAGETVGDQEPAISAARVAVVGALSAAAAGIVLGGLFQGPLGRTVGVGAAVVGAGLVYLGVRSSRVMLQFLAAPAVFIAGYLAALVLPNATGVRGTVPTLVRQALRNGGLAHPPVPFDPGWRFLLAALIGLVAAAAVSLAVGFRRPRLAILLPLPLVVAGALNQPDGHELVGGGAALALMLVALSVSYSAELAGVGEVTRRFEVRQLGTSAAATAAAVAALVLLSHVGALFPEPSHSSASNPQKPKIVPLSAVRDRPLFDAPTRGPYRVGVLDTYQGGSWLLPPFDPATTKVVPDGRPVPGESATRSTTPQALTVRDLGGFTLPTPADAVSIDAGGTRIGYDTARDTLRLVDGAVPNGFRYTVRAATPPNGDTIAAAIDKPIPAAIQGFTTASPEPIEIAQLVKKAPSTNRWDQLQYLRHTLYQNVIAAHGGVPVPVDANRVIAMLHKGLASPFEIVAAEALLARWVGIPSRIGFGYYSYSATKSTSGGYEFRPVDGANWLEIYVPGSGWTPVLGTPLHAQADLNAQRNTQQNVLPSSQLTLQIYVPVLTTEKQLAFQVVRFWVVRIVPLLVALWLLWRAIPIPARAWRRRRRRAWARLHGPAGRIAVAYAEFRDVARDLRLDDGTTTPIGFLDLVEDDREHRELAWLTTRALWGDLQRDLRDDDAAAAETMAASLRRRLARAQGGLTRVTALSSRTSLRAPWDPALPNAWPQVRLPRVRVPSLRALRRRARRLRFRPALRGAGAS